MESIVRLYNMEDEVMISRAKVQHGLLTTDLALFTAKFPWIDATYLTSYLTDTNTADAFPVDDTVMTNLTVLTSDVNASMDEGKNALKMLFLYAEITYPKDKVKQRVFGQDRMDKARNDQEKMENLLEHANSMARNDPYKTDLLGKGYTQLQIDGLMTISDNISTKNTLQESAKAKRPVTTQDRIKVYNIVFDRMSLISTCAQVVFFGDAAKIEQYRAYPSSSGATTTASVHVVNPSSQPMADLTVNIEGTDRTTDAGGIAATFDLGTNPPDAVDVTISGAGINPSPQTFNHAVLDGEVNLFEFTVTV